ncbi:MAG: asparagine synthase C-terminal domain-containing protein [Candidatus Hydrothermarchaeales archaeon]
MKYIVDLDSALEGAVERCTSSQATGILFSGGLDSSLIAKIYEDLNMEATLYSVAMPGSHDFEHIRGIEEFFKFDVKLRELAHEELEGYARRVIAAIKNRDPLHVSIGIPFYAACEEAKSDGMKAILIGQGADELFAGYHRYLRMPPEELEKSLVQDLEKLLQVDIKRDEAIARANELELKAPYLDEELVNMALNIPIDLKIKGDVRKFILREVAKRRGLPRGIIESKKKAVQYSTGVDKALRKIAKQNKNSLREYLESLC